MELTFGDPRLPERFWSKVAVNYDSGCWEWQAAKSHNYGRFYYAPMKTASASQAHRVAYEFLVGHIPEDKHLDHLCRNPPCVNPGHLEPVTPRENIMRGVLPETLRGRPFGHSLENALKTHCKHGHLLLGDNLMVFDGHRACRSCHRERSRKRYVPGTRAGMGSTMCEICGVSHHKSNRSYHMKKHHPEQWADLKRKVTS